MSRDSGLETWKRGSLFWRLWFRSLVVRRSQAAVAIVSLLAGAAVASMLLNLYGDVRRKMTQEFRAYGANVLVSPAASGSEGSGLVQELMDEPTLERLRSLRLGSEGFEVSPVLFLVGRVSRVPADPRLPEFENVVVTGAELKSLHSIVGTWRGEGSTTGTGPEDGSCIVGVRLAESLHLDPGGEVQLRVERQGSLSHGGEGVAGFRVASVVTTGSSEDDQMFVSLPTLQKLSGLEGKISLVEMVIPGGSVEIERDVQEIRAAVPELDVRPVRQIVYSQGRVLETLRWLLVSLTALIVLIIALCVMATMTAIVIERRKDIAVMKALGAGNRTVGRLFLSEGASLGFIAGLAGFPLGVLLASELTRRLFGVGLNVVWWTLPLICAGTVLVAALATSFPAGIIRRIQPAAILKGE